MSFSIIPAAPGFYAVKRQPNGSTAHLPVIAWRLSERAFNNVEVTAIGLDGLFDEDTVIVGPDGRPAHE